MAVAADQDVDRGQRGGCANDVTQDERDLGPVGGLAGPQNHRHRLAADRLVDVDRQEAPAVVVGMEQRQLLPAVDPILGVVPRSRFAGRRAG